jgi:hypothetical protein
MVYENYGAIADPNMISQAQIEAGVYPQKRACIATPLRRVAMHALLKIPARASGSSVHRSAAIESEKIRLSAGRLPLAK